MLLTCDGREAWDSAMRSAKRAMEPDEKYVFTYKGFYFQPDLVSAEYLDTLEDFEIRDSDVFLVTYPKSGTIWTQNILSLIYHEGHRDGTEKVDLLDRAPWLEYNIRNVDYDSRPSPRLFASHLPYYLVPKGLRNRRAKVVYVARNPKDVMVSFYHFSKMAVKFEEVEDFGIFMERFLAGKVLASSWLDHVEGWYSHKDDFNILFLTYEEMKKDLRSSVLKLCNFLGKRLTEKEVDAVVDQATFNKMKADPRANYEFMPLDILDHSKGPFLRKGTVGDWKNMMTVAQSERFDSVFKKRMEKLPFKFCWDIHEES
ncbi:amine sulfotransferase-like isoform X1 [Podarcis raffonei]|uniref:amine sulfotransferase-like isoform X1 n=1 Tax=Podarcis raffonei TaxID=65483 RepID=UPI0023299456|nr:amine sulfotransferase-like isoform X1 [Podarcis raffonei]